MSLYEDLRKLGINVLLDDRNERYGVKMNDFELMGFNYALIIGKSLENNELELVKRKDLSKIKLKADTALTELKKVLL